MYNKNMHKSSIMNKKQKFIYAKVKTLITLMFKLLLNPIHFCVGCMLSYA